MAETVVDNATNSSTVIIEKEERDEVPVLKLRLRKPKQDKKVKWTNETVDNENMNKKKSKCCCIYQKPRKFDDSSSDDEDECENCKGHVEKHKQRGDEPSETMTEN